MLVRSSTAVTAFVLCLGLACAATPTTAIARSDEIAENAEPSHTVAEMADWVLGTGDNQNLPFAIIDKANAQIVVFDVHGQMVGVTAALVGLAPGDDSAPGIGDRELSDMPPEERTTPAGRFVGGYGPATGGREVLWVDFSTAISLHPVVTTKPQEKRLERLESPAADDNRITYGCINVAEVFYSDVVRPTFSGAGGVFYVLPDTKRLAEVFPGLGETALASRGDPAMSGPSGPHHPSEWW